MSRGFVKEEDQEDAPMIPPRAVLPSGMINYVTPEGLQALKEEKKELERAYAQNQGMDETELRRKRAVIDGQLQLLSERIGSARVIRPSDQPEEEIRFGAKVRVKDLGTGQENEFRIVGVDEADIKRKKISFVAPLARALLGHRKNQEVTLHLGKEDRNLLIMDISY